MARQISVPQPPDALKRAAANAGGAARGAAVRFGPVVILLLAAVALVVAEFMAERWYRRARLVVDTRHVVPDAPHVRSI